MNWDPHVTVAAVIEKNGQFLFVEEMAGGKIVLNQPAGHWEANETLVDAVVREVYEETAWRFTPGYLIGVYQWLNTANNQTFLRFCFGGELVTHDPNASLDPDILRTIWFSHDELVNNSSRYRSPLVLKCVNDYRNGLRHDLGLIQHIIEQ